MTVLVGDCVERLRELEAASIDAIVCDPPYHLSFMGIAWDHAPTGAESQAQHRAWAREALRALRPGGHLLAFGGTRTFHRLACGVEDAGFEIRDCLMWVYGSGFPKSLDVSKAIDKAAGAERKVVGSKLGQPGYSLAEGPSNGVAMEGNVDGSLRDAEAECAVTAPATPNAERWQGWGTALKPGWEPIVVARKPLSGTVAGNAQAHGTGALNIDGCRIEGVPRTTHVDGNRQGSAPQPMSWGESNGFASDGAGGRWPANVVLSHSEDCVMVGDRQVRANGHHPSSRGASGFGANDGSNAGGLRGHDGLVERRADGELVERWACVPGCPVRMLDDQTGDLHAPGSFSRPSGYAATSYQTPGGTPLQKSFTDAGGPSRFFYCAKASRAERNAGVGGASTPLLAMGATPQDAEDADWSTRNGNHHPTVKPIDLMRWLVRLVTPPGGTVLDCFMGSGTTGCAAILEGFEFVGIERDAEYAAIAEARMKFWREHPTHLPAELALEADARRRKVRESGQLGML